MNSSDPTSARPGKHELLTLVALFLSGSCAIMATVVPFAFFGAALLMAVGLVGLWRSESWSFNAKAFSTVFLLLLYVGLAIMATISLTIGIEPAAIRFLYHAAILAMVFGVPAGIGAWMFLLLKTLLARASTDAGHDRPAAA